MEGCGVNLRSKALFVGWFPWTVGLFPGQAVADVQAVIACRQLPPGPDRSDCLERASAALEREQTAPPANPAAGDGHYGEFQPQLPRGPDRISAGVLAVSYQDGRPVLQLANGQTWYSTDRRQLTFKPGRSHVVIAKSPVGMLMHFDGSLFALQVVRRD
jgi:hypothetical protein